MAARSTALGNEMLSGYIWMSPERVSVGEEGEGHSIDGPNTGKACG